MEVKEMELEVPRDRLRSKETLGALVSINLSRQRGVIPGPNITIVDFEEMPHPYAHEAQVLRGGGCFSGNDTEIDPWVRIRFTESPSLENDQPKPQSVSP